MLNQTHPKLIDSISSNKVHVQQLGSQPKNTEPNKNPARPELPGPVLLGPGQRAQIIFGIRAGLSHSGFTGPKWPSPNRSWPRAPSPKYPGRAKDSIGPALQESRLGQLGLSAVSLSHLGSMIPSIGTKTELLKSLVVSTGPCSRNPHISGSYQCKIPLDLTSRKFLLLPMNYGGTQARARAKNIFRKCSISAKMAEGLTYKDAGVDIDAGSELVRRIAKMAPGIGGFGGLFPLGDSYLDVDIEPYRGGGV
ncbi:hypothetical protein NL676_008792 [Syzygium grande]|nr:hypothetical protein NL676_008792 [Syzygium grande]